VSGFVHTARSEWIKLRSTRTTLVLVLIAVGLEALVVGLTAVFADLDGLEADVLVNAVTFTSIPAGLLIAVVGSLAITSEYAHGTIRPTFAATPRREQVFAAKFVVVTVTVAVGSAVVIGLATILGWVVMSARGAELDLTAQPGNVPALIGSVILIVLLTWMGYGLGLLTRSSPLAIVILVLWPLLIENLIGGVLFVAGVENAVRWLPYNAGALLALTEQPDDALGRWQGGLYFGVVTLALVVAGALTNRHRDA
jgi:ABC-2 type transport system permease protein